MAVTLEKSFLFGYLDRFIWKTQWGLAGANQSIDHKLCHIKCTVVDTKREHVVPWTTYMLIWILDIHLAKTDARLGGACSFRSETSMPICNSFHISAYWQPRLFMSLCMSLKCGYLWHQNLNICMGYTWDQINFTFLHWWTY